MNNLTLVIPAKEESDSLPIVLKELSKYNHHIIVSVEQDDIDTINSVKEYDCQVVYQFRKGYGNAIYTFMEQMMIEGYHTFYVVSEGGYLHFKIATETTLDELQKEEARYYPPTIYTEYEFDKNTITNEISTLLQLDR